MKRSVAQINVGVEVSKRASSARNSRATLVVGHLHVRYVEKDLLGLATSLNTEGHILEKSRMHVAFVRSNLPIRAT